MVQLLAGIISLRRVLEANPGRSHGSADTLPLRHSANFNEGELACHHISPCRSLAQFLCYSTNHWCPKKHHNCQFNSQILCIYFILVELFYCIYTCRCQRSASREQCPLTMGIVRRQFPSLRGTMWCNNGSSRGDCPFVALRSTNMTVGDSKAGLPVDDFCKLVRLMDMARSQNLLSVPESDSCPLKIQAYFDTIRWAQKL